MLPDGTVGAELVRRGHRVTVLAQSRAAPLTEKLGLPLHELNFDDVPRSSSWILWKAFESVGAGVIAGMRGAFRWHAEAMLRKLPNILQDLAFDGAIVDQNISEGGTLAEHAGLPFVTVASAAPWYEEIGVPPPFTHSIYGTGLRHHLRSRMHYAGWHWFMRPTMKLINTYRRQWALPPIRRVNDLFSPLAQVSQLCAEFDFPRRRLPRHFHFIGSLAADRQLQNDSGFPWDRLDGRRIIFASLGTIPDPANPPVFRKILQACDGLDAQLVLALGKWSQEHVDLSAILAPVPRNALVVDFVPQMALLDKAALLITHAGSNTVVEALHRGVPMVALPRSADQPGMAARIEYSGAGLRASFYRSTPEELRQIVQRVLDDERFSRRAKELQQAMRAAGGAARAADIVAQALTTRRPVRREE